MVTVGIGRQARERVPRPLVDPDVGWSLADLHGEPAAIGREEEIEPVRGRRPAAASSSPRDPSSGAVMPAPVLCPGRYTSVPLADTANCAPPVHRVRCHAFERGHRLTRHLQPVEIEGRRKERPVVHVDQMAARQIPAVIAPATGPPFASPLGSGCTTRFASL